MLRSQKRNRAKAKEREERTNTMNSTTMTGSPANSCRCDQQLQLWSTQYHLDSKADSVCCLRQPQSIHDEVAWTSCHPPQTWDVETSKHDHLVMSKSLHGAANSSTVRATAAMKDSKAACDGITVATTSRFDVLLGKGRDIQNYSGNVRFRCLADIHLPRYEAANRVQKAQIIDFIVDAIYESSGRFLKDNGNGSWELASYDEARAKAGKLFRARRANHQRKQHK